MSYPDRFEPRRLEATDGTILSQHEKGHTSAILSIEALNTLNLVRKRPKRVKHVSSFRTLVLFRTPQATESALGTQDLVCAFQPGFWGYDTWELSVQQALAEAPLSLRTTPEEGSFVHRNGGLCAAEKGSKLL